MKREPINPETHPVAAAFARAMAEPVVPYAQREEVEARLRAKGFTVFAINWHQHREFVRTAGLPDWLRAQGYDPDSTETVHFKIESGQGFDRPMCVVGAVRLAAEGAQ
ncbi:MAG: hypothetical protein JWM10_4096 [Myxococcaceae bacterium]|nr:hypothetical protein [Myxococcaceae bacterium]